MRVIFTDVTVYETITLASLHSNPLTKKCRDCGLTKRQDMYHCTDCGTCSELFDHHCGVVGVCICAKNYKYFILFICYGGLSIMSLANAFNSLTSNCTNKVIQEHISETYSGSIFGAAFTGISYLIMGIGFLCNTAPGCIETANFETRVVTSRLAFLHKYRTG